MLDSAHDSSPLLQPAHPADLSYQPLDDFNFDNILANLNSTGTESIDLTALVPNAAFSALPQLTDSAPLDPAFFQSYNNP